MRFSRVVTAFLVIALAIPAVGQETNASIAGDVTDSSGALLPGVTVEALSTRGQRFTTETDANGRYRFPAVPVGTYTITARLAGLEDAIARNIQATLSRTPEVDLTLRIGALAETVTVTAEAPIVDTTSSATATSVTREEIQSLPRGRDFTDVVAFTPGATNDPTLAGGISIDGSTGLENRFIIDGIDTTDPQIGNNAVPMRAEFMEEVQVKSSGYTAEFGGAHHVFEYAVDDVLLKDAQVAVLEEVFLQRLQFQAALVGHVADGQDAEVREAGLGTN